MSKLFETIITALKELIPLIFMYKAGKDSINNDILEEENETLKEFQKIDELEITKDELANLDNWK